MDNAMIRRFDLHFSFHEPEEKDLARLNRMLAATPLSSLTLENLKVCMASEKEYTRTGRLRSERLRCGLSSGTARGELRAGKNAYLFQVETEVVENGRVLPGGAYAEDWRSRHPGCFLRMIATYEFFEGYAYVVVYGTPAHEEE